MFAALIKPKWKPNSKDTLYEFFWCSLVTSTASLHDWSSVAQIHFVQQFASVRERTRLQHAIETEPAFRLLVQHALFLAQVGATATGRSISWKSKLEKTCHRHKHLKHITLATISKQHFHTRHHQGQIPNGTKLHWVWLQRAHVHKALVRLIVRSVWVQRAFDRLRFVSRKEPCQQTWKRTSQQHAYSIFALKRLASSLVGRSPERPLYFGATLPCQDMSEAFTRGVCEKQEWPVAAATRMDKNTSSPCSDSVSFQTVLTTRCHCEIALETSA